MQSNYELQKILNVLSVKVKIKSHENVIISGTYHYMYINTTTGMFTNASKRHPKGIQKSLQNTSPRGVNAAVKSVIRLLVHLKSRTPPPSIFPSGVTPIWRGCTVTSLWTNQKQV